MSQDSSHESWSESRLDRQSRMHSDGWSTLTGGEDDSPAPRRSARHRGRGAFGLWTALVLAVVAGALMLMIVRYVR